MPADVPAENSVAVPICPVWPDSLARVDLALLRFNLEFLSPCPLDLAGVLGLRRSLRLSARQVLGERGQDGLAHYRALFEPDLSADPVALKKFQKPSPPFVLRPQPDRARALEPGEGMGLDVLFLGGGIASIEHFLAALVRLGRLGLIQGEGRFEVTDVLSSDLSGAQRSLSPAGRPAPLAPDVLSVGDWLDHHLPRSQPVRLDIVTPARLLVDGRPLRQPRFDQVFPFMLRRVTSQLHAHCNLELDLDAEYLLSLARSLEVRTDLRWLDWRTLPGPAGGQNLGGFLGAYWLSGEDLDTLLWVIALAGLLGVGKSAAYGAGQMFLSVA